jgi:hypothetical protein
VGDADAVVQFGPASQQVIKNQVPPAFRGYPEMFRLFFRLRRVAVFELGVSFVGSKFS